MNHFRMNHFGCVIFVRALLAGALLELGKKSKFIWTLKLSEFRTIAIANWRIPAPISRSSQKSLQFLETNKRSFSEFFEILRVLIVSRSSQSFWKALAIRSLYNLACYIITAKSRHNLQIECKAHCDTLCGSIADSPADCQAYTRCILGILACRNRARGTERNPKEPKGRNQRAGLYDS